MARLLRRQEELIERWTAAGGPGFDGRARALLADVGLADDDLGKPTRVLSGGQRKLVGLAACLLRDPDVLLLDEPEAHLDVEAREHMEHLMRSFDGAVVAVSHDRYLLDETVAHIAELVGGRIRMWPGNYSAYTVARELELQRQQQLYVTQQKEIARLEEAIRRFKDWASRVVDERHIKQARNKQRQIDRMEKIDRPVLERRKIALDLRPHARGGERVVELPAVGVELGGMPILAGVDLTVLRGERVGVVGENGAGKSVLLRVLADDLAPTEGERKAGPSIRFGRLAQDRRPDDPRATPLQLVRHAAPISEGEAVSRLMKFLFSYEQVRRPLETLSGGEWTRLQLLLLMLQGANCLLLDEPTNHLDIESVEMLEGALEEFDGTAIFVSHDRYFLDRIADRIVEVADGDVRSYEGGWSSWRERQAVRGLGSGRAERGAVHGARDADELRRLVVDAFHQGDGSLERHPAAVLVPGAGGHRPDHVEAGGAALEVGPHCRDVLGMHDRRRTGCRRARAAGGRASSRRPATRTTSCRRSTTTAIRSREPSTTSR